ncbi:MAG: DNA-processing protein DprA [Planctomycetes bacterium]|nr:DNA-processing protein DprA [Planctomycetota bacterium]
MLLEPLRPASRRLPLSPMARASLVDVLRIHLATLHRGSLAGSLLARFGDPGAVLCQSRETLLSLPGMGRRVADRLLSRESAAAARQEIERCAALGISVLRRPEASYPRALVDLPEMPILLFCRGEVLDPQDAASVGIVGPRRPSPYGLRQARRFARSLAERGVTIVSGLARGVDAAAQRAAIEAGGRTIAVLGSGLANIYPPEHRLLVEEIVRGRRGAVLSEFPADAPPRSFHFPQRNRLLSGLSAAILLIEAGERSGSLITVDWALRQGKSVFVLPGRVEEPQAVGALRLLRDGAAPAIEPDDLLAEVLPSVRATAGGRSPPAGAGDAGAVIALPGWLGPRLSALFREEDVWHADAIAARLEIETSELLVELARLELRGCLERTADGGYAPSGRR